VKGVFSKKLASIPPSKSNYLEMLLFISSFLLIWVFSLSQLNQLFAIQGIQPNISLAILVVYAFMEKDWLRRSALVLLTIFLLNFSPTLGLEAIFTMIVLFIVLTLVDYFKWQPTLSAVIIVLIATILLNAFSIRPGVILIESIYNVFLVGLFGLLLSFINSKRSSLNA